MDPVIAQIREELKFHGDPKIQKTSQRFFKEEITCYGKDENSDCNCKKVLERGKRDAKAGNIYPVRGIIPFRLH